MWHRFRLRAAPTIRAVGPLVVLGATVGLGAAQLGFPEKWLWDESGDGPVLATIGAVIGSAAYGVFKLFDDRTLAKQARLTEQAENVERLCRKAFVPINETLPRVPVGKIGVHVWRVANDQSQLLRLHKYTMEQERLEMGFVWTPGRGALGLAWDGRAPIAVTHLSALVARANRMGAADFDALPARERCGLRRTDLVGGSRYEAILAVPLFAAESAAGADDPAVLGLVSVDLMQDVDEGDLQRLLKHPDFSSFLGTCQNYLRWLARTDA